MNIYTAIKRLARDKDSLVMWISPSYMRKGGLKPRVGEAVKLKGWTGYHQLVYWNPRDQQDNWDPWWALADDLLCDSWKVGKLEKFKKEMETYHKARFSQQIETITQPSTSRPFCKGDEFRYGKCCWITNRPTKT